MNSEMKLKLMNNERPLFVLMRDDPEMVEAFKNHQKDVGWFDGNCVDSVGAVLFDSPCGIYRLRNDYVEPVERWFVCITDTPANGKLVTGTNLTYPDNWLELKTPEELEYVKNRPEGATRIGVVKIGDIFWHSQLKKWTTSPTNFLPENGPRWIKDEPICRFVEYKIERLEAGYYAVGDTGVAVCSLDLLPCSPKPLGIFAGVQFEGCSDWAMSLSMFTDGKGGMSIFESITYNKIAIPVKARFHVLEVGK